MPMEVKSALPQMLLTDALGEIAAPALGVVCVMEASCSAAIAEDAMGIEIGRLSTNAKEFTRWVDAAGRWSSWAAERRTMFTCWCVSFTPEQAVSALLWLMQCSREHRHGRSAY